MTPMGTAVGFVTEGSLIRLVEEYVLVLLYTIPVPVLGFGFGLVPGVGGGDTGECRLDVEFE